MQTSSNSNSVPVLLIGGLGRSGSTLLGRALGLLDGAVSVGEVTHLWLRGLKENNLCGCGAAFHDCQFWNSVGDAAFGGWGNVDIDEVLVTSRLVDRHRHIPVLGIGRGTAHFEEALRQHTQRLSSLYQAMHKVSGEKVILDASKNAPYGWLLNRVPRLDMRVLHLVRDSRAVAYSWSRSDVRRPEVTSEVRYMRAVPEWKTAMYWLTDNASYEALGKAGVPVKRWRYEDFTAEPAETVNDIANFAGLTVSKQVFEDLTNRQFVPRNVHEVSGNPMRFGASRILIRQDENWIHRMSPGARRMVSVLTAPGLARYGYQLR